MYTFVSLLHVKNCCKDTQFHMRKTAKFVCYNLLVFGQISCFFTRDLLVFQILEWHVCYWSKHGKKNLHFPNIRFMSWKIITEEGLMSGELITMMIWPTFRKWKKMYAVHIHIMMGAMASQITSLVIVYATVYSDADQRKHQSSASLAFVRGIHQGPVNSLYKVQ